MSTVEKKILVWQMTFGEFSGTSEITSSLYNVNITILKISNSGRVTSFIKPSSPFVKEYQVFGDSEIYPYIGIHRKNVTMFTHNYRLHMIHESFWRRCMYAWLLALIKIIHCLSTSSNKVISSVPWYRFTLLHGQNIFQGRAMQFKLVSATLFDYMTYHRIIVCRNVIFS